MNGASVAEIVAQSGGRLMTRSAIDVDEMRLSNDPRQSRRKEQ